MDPREMGRKRVALGQCAANAAAERIDYVFFRMAVGREVDTEAPLGPARGSQPGAQAGRRPGWAGNGDWFKIAARARKRVGTFCAKHPSGRSGKTFLTAFPANQCFSGLHSRQFAP